MARTLDSHSGKYRFKSVMRDQPSKCSSGRVTQCTGLQIPTTASLNLAWNSNFFNGPVSQRQSSGLLIRGSRFQNSPGPPKIPIINFITFQYLMDQMQSLVCAADSYSVFIGGFDPHLVLQNSQYVILSLTTVQRTVIVLNRFLVILSFLSAIILR